MCAVAEADEASLEMMAPSSAISIGDRVEVKVQARGGEDLLWGDVRILIETGGPWEVIDGPHAIAGTQPPAWKVSLVAMEVGELSMPDCAVDVRSSDGSESEVRAQDVPTITVASVLVDENETDPSPLKDPVGVRGFPWEWAPPVLVVVVPLLLFVIWWWRRQRRDGDLESRIELLPPIEELIENIKGLRARIGRDTAGGCCDQLAYGVRRYLERRSGEPAMDMTTFELRLLGRRLGWPDGVQRGVQRAMDVADSVRFGRRPASETQLISVLDVTIEAARQLETHLVPKVDSSDEETGQ